MIGKLDTMAIEKVLNEQVLGHIGCHDANRSYVIPVSYAYDGECVYIRSFEGEKLRIMRKNPQVCFQVEIMKTMANWKSVMAWGEFEELNNTQDRIKGLKLLVDRKLPLVSSETTHLGTYWPFPPDELNSITGVIFRIRLTEKTGRFEMYDSVENVQV